MLLAIAFGWFLSISVRMIYPVLLPYLRDAHSLTLTTAGLLLTMLWIGYAFGQLPGGILTDWVGERLLLVAGSVLAGTMLILVTIANSATILFLSTALFGVTTALYGVARFTILSEIYSDQLGTATGVTMAAGDIGNAVMPPVATFIAAVVAWQYGFSFTVPLFMLAAVSLWITLPNNAQSVRSLSESLALDEIIPTLSRPVVLRGTILLVLSNIILQAFVGFYPTYLIDVKELSAQVATLLFGLFFALGILVKPIAGRTYDSIGIRSPLLVIMCLVSLSLITLPFVEEMWLFILLTVLVSSLLGFETIVISDLTYRLPDRTQGTNLGALRTIYIALGGLSPFLFGVVADREYFDEAFLGIAFLAGAIVLIVFALVDD